MNQISLPQFIICLSFHEIVWQNNFCLTLWLDTMSSDNLYTSLNFLPVHEYNLGLTHVKLKSPERVGCVAISQKGAFCNNFLILILFDCYINQENIWKQTWMSAKFIFQNI